MNRMVPVVRSLWMTPCVPSLRERAFRASATRAETPTAAPVARASTPTHDCATGRALATDRAAMLAGLTTNATMSATAMDEASGIARLRVLRMAFPPSSGPEAGRYHEGAYGAKRLNRSGLLTAGGETISGRNRPGERRGPGGRPPGPPFRFSSRAAPW